MNWLPTLSQHLMISALALLVYVLTTRVRSVRRPPTAAIAWVMGLGLVPYLFLPLFFLFGIRKLKAVRASRMIRSYVGEHWAQALIDTFGAHAPEPAIARFHANGEEARLALFEVIDAASETLDVCTFLVSDDSLGRSVVERLLRRAREGVRVRLMVDAVGTWLASPPRLADLRRAGAQVAVFNPVASLSRKIPRNLRNHRKMVIADDRWLWSGGRNLAAEYFEGASGAAPWIDLSFDLQGATAAAAARQFELDWKTAHREPGRDIAARPAAQGVGLTQFVPSGPDQAEDTVHALMLAACFQARNRLLAVTPYFVPDDSLLTAMRLAALRGVEITLVLPSKSNHRLADFVRGRALRVLAQAGVRIRLVPRMVHAKAVVVDDSLAWCGSVNLDSRSLLINYESVVVFYGQPEIRWLAGWVGSLGERGEPFAARRVGLVRDLAEGLLLAVAFQM
ncbi:MAG: phospholipase D-like domain-containing protein [Gammaproteobacteria bacterium]